MDASRGQSGIQLLLAAEQEAQHIVNAARSGSSFSYVGILLSFLTPAVIMKAYICLTSNYG